MLEQPDTSVEKAQNSVALLYWIFAFAKGNGAILNRLVSLLKDRGLLTEEMPSLDDELHAIVSRLHARGGHNAISKNELSTSMRKFDALVASPGRAADDEASMKWLLSQMIINEGNFPQKDEHEDVLKLRQKTSVCTCVLLGKMPHAAFDFLVPKLRGVVGSLEEEFSTKLRALIADHNKRNPEEAYKEKPSDEINA